MEGQIRTRAPRQRRKPKGPKRRRGTLLVGGILAVMLAAVVALRFGVLGSKSHEDSPVAQPAAAPDSPSADPGQQGAKGGIIARNPKAPISKGPTYDVETAPGTASHYVGARKDAAVATCVGHVGSTNAAGTLTNPTDAEASYRVYVSAVDSEGSALGLGEVDKTVAAGQTAHWEFQGKFGASGAQCVLRVERSAP